MSYRKQYEKRPHPYEEILNNPHTLTSNTLIDSLDSGRIPRAHNPGLGDFVALLGSTHGAANWREESSLGALARQNVHGYTPRMENWEPIHAKAEARALSEASVIGIRLENKDIKNGSVGSIVEWGFAILSAKLNGQRLVVSIEPGFEESLTDPAVKAQFQALREMLADAKHGNGLVVEEYSDLEEFNSALIRARQEQLNSETALKPMTSEDFRAFYAERRARLTRLSREVTLSGSSGAFGTLAQERFAFEQSVISRMFGESDDFEALNVGAGKDRWDIAHETQNENKYRRAFQMEKGVKAGSDILLWVIQDESVSLSAVTEIGFLLAQALNNGQQVAVLLEDFDVDAYIHTQLYDKANIRDQADQVEFTASQSLLQEIEELYLQARQEDRPFTLEVLREAISFIRRAQKPSSEGRVTFQELQNNDLLRQTSLFEKADTARRARAIAKEQFSILQKRMKQLAGETENEPFILSTDFTDYIQKIQLIKDPVSAEKRAGFWDGFHQFKEAIESLRDRGRSGELSPTELVDEAVNMVNPREKRFAGLTGHLSEITEYTGRWKNLLTRFRKKDGQPYLSERKMQLLQEVVSPLHDLLKFLGSPDQQAMPDHEVLIEYVIRKYFPELGFTDEEVEFMAAVCGDHENIFKEKGRSKFASSDSEIDRAKALFFMLDTLTGVVEEEDGVLKINQDELRKRFTDLYFRHIDPVKGKTYRPEWGFSAINDFIGFFRELETQYGVELEPGFIETIVNVGAIEAIEKAISENDKRASTDTQRLTADQITELQTTIDQLRRNFIPHWSPQSGLAE